MQVSEVGSGKVPVRLFALQVQLDQVDEHPLQVLNKGA